ncbi:hypothetical protein CF326_g504 [Tilletia indica]|uniref:Uncharacterized protein n=1 Tax=Tilletia indica TaxID=43049 RepID=A0A177TGS8_9BASI|nr:hypothetical protein CF326_g504 [Tilletia indica]KAE8258355.1 hypothetical protein A4X13_0g1743 [Tilletia indica]
MRKYHRASTHGDSHQPFASCSLSLRPDVNGEDSLDGERSSELDRFVLAGLGVLTAFDRAHSVVIGSQLSSLSRTLRPDMDAYSDLPAISKTDGPFLPPSLQLDKDFRASTSSAVYPPTSSPPQTAPLFFFTATRIDSSAPPPPDSLHHSFQSRTFLPTQIELGNN